jgi:hypothetical protein
MTLRWFLFGGVLLQTSAFLLVPFSSVGGVLYGMLWQSLRLLFIEDSPMSLVFFRYLSFFWCAQLLGMDGDPSDEVLHFRFGVKNILGLGGESCLLSV